VPKDVSEAVQKLLVEKSIQLLDATASRFVMCGSARKSGDARREQIKTGVTSRGEAERDPRRHPAPSRLERLRKQRSAGIYTMRLAYQPTDGKHTADVSDFQEFVLMIKAAADTKPVLMEAKHCTIGPATASTSRIRRLHVVA